MRFKNDEARREWDEHRENAIAQKDLFVDVDSTTKDLRFCPVQYRVKFVCDDAACTTEHDFAILDWGLYVLHMKQYADRGGPMATQKVIEAIEQRLDPAKHEAYLFLGNTKAHCLNFSIVAFFHPPRPPAGKPAVASQPKLPGFD